MSSNKFSSQSNKLPSQSDQGDELFKDAVIENTPKEEAPAKAAKAPEDLSSPAATAKRAKVEADTNWEDWALVVDDSPASANVIAGVLKTVGVGSHVFRSATAAFDFLKTASDEEFAKILTVFSDFQMPGMNGLEFLTELRQNPRTKAMPFVVVSGQVEKPMLPKLTALKIDGYIIKPFKSQSIIDRITHIKSAKAKAAS